MVEQIRRFVHSAAFQRFILSLIIVSGVLVGMETYPAFSDATPAGRAISIIQDLILWVFVGEIVLKIAACGSRPWDYFRQGWNLFDFAIVVVCFLPFHTQFATVFRLARLLRTLRMVTILPRLQILVGALLKAIPSLGYIGILLGLHFYVYACAGTFLFGKNDPVRFGTLHETTLTLFQVLTLEGWNDVLATEYHGSDLGYDDGMKEKTAGLRVSQAQPLVASVYFVTFILLGTMIMLNLFTGVIISSMEEAQEERAEESREESIKKKGFLTLHDELAILSQQLVDITQRLKSIELKGERTELEREEAVVGG
jgi:voltage-gated sodium channel